MSLIFNIFSLKELNHFGCDFQGYAYQRHEPKKKFQVRRLKFASTVSNWKQLL